VDTTNNLGQALRERRKAKKLNLKQVAERAGVSAPHIARVERGERFPSGRVLRKLAEPLDFSEAELMELAGFLSKDDASRRIERMKSEVTTKDEVNRILDSLDPNSPISFGRVAREICQLFEQKKLDKPELRERIEGLRKQCHEAVSIADTEEQGLDWIDKAFDQLLPLYPDIEEAKREERERIIKYLKIRWRSYKTDKLTGVWRHAFALPEDWEQALKEE